MNVGYYGDQYNSGIIGLYFKQTCLILQPEAQKTFSSLFELQFSCLKSMTYWGNYNLLKVNNALKWLVHDVELCIKPYHSALDFCWVMIFETYHKKVSCNLPVNWYDCIQLIRHGIPGCELPITTDCTRPSEYLDEKPLEKQETPVTWGLVLFLWQDHWLPVPILWKKILCLFIVTA